MKQCKVFLSLFLAAIFLSSTTNAQKQFKALLVTITNGWRHESVHAGVLAIQQLAVRNNFDLVYFDDPNSFTDKNLAQYQLVIFLSTTGNIFDSTQKKVMERFIESGKGYVGIHSASDTEYGWDWYTKLVGRMFQTHPAIQTAKLKVLDPAFP
ncbi:MAG: ThuA domain-containing protein, partial [Bacteroidota bacterium]|nr:ThuA domain-containing protein [Bacteroidota bacterium]